MRDLRNGGGCGRGVGLLALHKLPVPSLARVRACSDGSSRLVVCSRRVSTKKRKLKGKNVALMLAAFVIGVATSIP